jgi:small subunit ribosomal protein S8
MYNTGDFLIRIKNAYMARKRDVELPFSKNNLAIAKVMVEEGYLAKIEEKEVEKKKTLHAQLSYKDRKPTVTEIKLVSTPSVHVYVKSTEIPRTQGGLGMTVISTPEGVLSGKKARQKGLGGKVICQIF